MKVKIVDPGFAGMTGMMGSVYFENGVSEEISTAEAERLGCIFAIETLEGLNPSSTQRLIDTNNFSYDEIVAVKSAPPAEQVEEKTEQVEEKPKAPVGVPADLSFSREDLEALADKEGIAGLRNIGSQFGIKCRSISEIIDELLALQAASKPQE